MKLFLGCWLVGLVLGNLPENWWVNSTVPDLTQQSAKSLIGKERHVVIDFFGPRCKYCYEMVEDWEQVKAHYNGEDSSWGNPDILISRVNAANEPELARQYGVWNYPTIMFLPANEDKTKHRFNGDRKAVDFIRWIDNLLEKYKDSPQNYREKLDTNKKVEKSNEKAAKPNEKVNIKQESKDIHGEETEKVPIPKEETKTIEDTKTKNKQDTIVDKQAEPKAKKPEEPKAEKQEEPKAKKPDEPKAKKPEEPKAKKPEEPKAKKPEEPKAKKPEEIKVEKQEEIKVEALKDAKLQNKAQEVSIVSEKDPEDDQEAPEQDGEDEEELESTASSSPSSAEMKWLSEIRTLEVELRELRTHFLREVQAVQKLSDTIKTQLKEESLNTLERHGLLTRTLEDLDLNMKTRNRIESTTTRINLTHFFLFTTLGLIVGVLSKHLLSSSKSFS